MISYVGVPWKSGWRAVNKALQAMLMVAGGSGEIWAPAGIPDRIDHALRSLRPSPTCLGCGRELSRLQVVGLDAGQAFEACEAAMVMPALYAWCNHFSA